MSIAQFTDLANKTGDTIVETEGHMINLVQQRAYTVATLIGGRSGPSVFKGSPTLRDVVYLKKEDRGQRYDPAGLQVDFTNPQIGTPMTSEWSFYYNYMSWSKPEIELNAPSAAGAKYRRTRYKEVLEGKQQNLWQSMVDQMEDEAWAPANFSAMRTTFQAPSSIPYFITEQSNGVPIQADGSAVTDIQGLSPLTAGQENWDNARSTYSSAGGAVAGSTDLLGELIRMGTNLHYHALPMKSEHGERETMSDVSFCSDNGLGYITAALRIGQDRWNAREMAGYGLMLNSVAYVNIPALDSALLYANDPSPTGLVTEGGLDSAGAADASAITGPRFYFVTKDALRTFFFQGQHFQVDEVERLTQAGRPNDYVQGANIWNQNWCADRRKLGIVSPSVDL